MKVFFLKHDGINILSTLIHFILSPRCQPFPKITIIDFSKIDQAMWGAIFSQKDVGWSINLIWKIREN